MKTKKPKAEDTFILKDDFVQVISKSGNEYHVTTENCNCMGYGFKGTCRHFKMAEEKGMLEQLKAKSVNLDFRNSPSVKKLRFDAVKQYLIKNSIAIKDGLIEFLEPKVCFEMKPAEFLTLAESWKKNS